MILLKVGSRSTVGMFGRSAYVKYAVTCHFRGAVVGESWTQAEYACFIKPGCVPPLRS